MAKGIYKRGNVYWIRYAGLDGQTVFESSGSRKFRDAQDKLIERKRAIKEGKQPEVRRIANHAFKELSEKYRSWIEGRQRSAKVKGYIIGQLVKRFGNLPLRRFSTALVEQLQTDNINRGLKHASNNKVLNVLKAIFTKAVDWEMVESETLKRVRKVKQLPENKRLRFISKTECQELISVCDPHLRPIVVTALNTGMRKGEIFNLKWDNVDLKHGFILLEITKNGERREIPINDTLRSTLQGITRRLDVPYVFFDPATGKSYQDLKRSFKSALRRAKIQDFHFHDLRHTFASLLVMAGVDLTTASRLLGHKDIKMTLRYAHLAPSHITRAVNILDEALNGTPTIQKLYNQGIFKEKEQCQKAVSH
ncbi:tyrosine recombinase XerD [bacterium BMS3Abin10]|nr:tyrosine recombinase XerD [bacterium BMS3Abin10]GBE38844.1 tyrosine recombinase XerD [bacterium BMS3Bbin08]